MDPIPRGAAIRFGMPRDGDVTRAAADIQQK
jgi:hypothetical protein